MHVNYLAIILSAYNSYDWNLTFALFCFTLIYLLLERDK